MTTHTTTRAVEMIEYQKLGCTIPELAEHFHCSYKEVLIVLVHAKKKLRSADYQQAKQKRKAGLEALKDTCRTRGLRYGFGKEKAGHYTAWVWHQPTDLTSAQGFSANEALEAALAEHKENPNSTQNSTTTS